MCKQFYTALLILCVFSFNVSAKNSDNPFAKNRTIEVGEAVSWAIDKRTVSATKTVRDGSGAYYHLRFDNKQIELLISSDASGQSAKEFSKLEIKDLKIDGKRNAVFSWCLNNQTRHNRFLQQGLTVKKKVCEVNGRNGKFVMRLNKDTLVALKNGSNLTVVVKPFRTPLELSYNISDYNAMFLALNAKAKPLVVVAESAAPAAVVSKGSKCWAKPPTKYKNIKSVEYSCSDVSAKMSAEAVIGKQVNRLKVNEKKLAERKKVEAEKQRKLAEDRKRKEQVAKLEQDNLLKAESAAIAASELKQSKIGDEITEKMISMCDKYWSKDEHRCYCQKYIEHAPTKIQQESTCE